MTILQNAIDSIQLGVEDFQSRDAKRLLSSVRNFHAGILLLFKHKLAVLSSGDDEALIRRDVLPTMVAGRLVWKGKGRKTVDVQQIKERFSSLGITVDWKRLDAMQDYRDDIEHYHTDKKPEVVRKYISDAFLLVRDFLINELDLDPCATLGAKTWDRLLHEKEVYDAERKACTAELDALEWSNQTARLWVDHAKCNNCGSDLIRPVTPPNSEAEDCAFECSICDGTWDYEGLLEISDSPHDTHQAHADGFGQVVGICPECEREGFDAYEDQCAFCGTTGPFECARCSSPIPVEELGLNDASLCGWCAHMSSKDD